MINTTYRKPRGRERVPFSYHAIRASEPLSSILAMDTSPSEAASRDPDVVQLAEAVGSLGLEDAGAASATHQDTSQRSVRRPRREQLRPLAVSLGSWGVDEIQICKMGSYGPEGEYVAEARCPVTP